MIWARSRVRTRVRVGRPRPEKLRQRSALLQLQMVLALTLTLVLALVRNIIIFSKVRVLVLNQPIYPQGAWGGLHTVQEAQNPIQGPLGALKIH